MNLNEQFRTFSEIRLEVLADFDASDNDTGLKSVIENSLRDNLQVFWHKAGDKFGARINKKFKILLRSGKCEYPLPPRYAGHYEMRHYVSGTEGYTKVLFMPFRDFNFKYGSETEATPEFFTIYGNDLVLGPTPDTTGDWVEFDFAEYADSPTDDNDLIMVPIQYIRALKLAVKGDVCEYQSKDQQGNILSNRSDELYKEISGIDHRRNNGGYNKMQIGVTRYGNFRER